MHCQCGQPTTLSKRGLDQAGADRSSLWQLFFTGLNVSRWTIDCCTTFGTQFLTATLC